MRVPVDKNPHLSIVPRAACHRRLVAMAYLVDLLTLVVATLALLCQGCHVAPATWAYLPPSAFDRSVTPQGLPAGWNNLRCAYEWRLSRDAPNATGADFTFRSPLGCMDPWQAAPANGTVRTNPDGGQTVTLRFDVVGSAGSGAGLPPLQVVKTGMVSMDCTMIDMADGGMYLLGVHPIDQAPHLWIKSATAWVMRAAQTTFADGTVHITPGYPTHYNGQWMRDSFYGISNGWDAVNSSRTRDPTSPTHPGVTCAIHILCTSPSL